MKLAFKALKNALVGTAILTSATLSAAEETSGHELLRIGLGQMNYSYNNAVLGDLLPDRNKTLDFEWVHHLESPISLRAGVTWLNPATKHWVRSGQAGSDTVSGSLINMGFGYDLVHAGWGTLTATGYLRHLHGTLDNKVTGNTWSTSDSKNRLALGLEAQFQTLGDSGLSPYVSMQFFTSDVSFSGNYKFFSMGVSKRY